MYFFYVIRTKIYFNVISTMMFFFANLAIMYFPMLSILQRYSSQPRDLDNHVFLLYYSDKDIFSTLFRPWCFLCELSNNVFSYAFYFYKDIVLNCLNRCPPRHGGHSRQGQNVDYLSTRTECRLSIYKAKTECRLSIYKAECRLSIYKARL